MIVKKALFLFIVLVSVIVKGQGKTIEVGLVTDNDLYTSSKNDMYYTNGLEFFYRHLAKNNKAGVNKTISEFRLGQYIYNPRSIKSKAIEKNDRPFAGYLFAEAGKTFFYQNESVINVSFQLGFIGPNSFGREMQSGFHHFFNYESVEGWKNQIKNAVALQSHFLFSKKLFPKDNMDVIDFYSQSETNLGTVFTGISSGFLTRIGFKKLVPIYNSNFYGASVNKDLRQIESEFYFYFHPSINYQLYDATIEGSLFNDSSPVTYDLIPFRFNGEAGLKYRKNNLNLSYAFIYKGKEVRHDLNTGYFYGSINVSYLFN
ncbi:lipid A deacylase LpxR family protein [Flavobacterium sp. W1B]|uniref:lipid A deacylase LpxR family protein n=1 Tax=Flavobacterium sp. W1B TaxID=3394146 RepID=UPI0039BC722D